MKFQVSSKDRGNILQFGQKGEDNYIFNPRTEDG